MNTNNIRRKGNRMLAILMAVMMLCGTVAITSMHTEAASKGKLVKTVKIYTKKGKKWKASGTVKYTYNSKKDPIIIVTKYTGYTYTQKFTYTYAGGKKVSMKEVGENPMEVTYDNSGRRIQESSEYYTSKITYDTKNKNLIKTISNDASGKTVFKYKYYKNKLPKYFKSSGNMSNTSAFNKKGFATNFRSYNVAEGNQVCKYSYKNGLVKTVIKSEKYDSQSYDTKYVFTYNSKKIPMARYRAMINEIMTGSAVACGTYWY